MDENKEMATSKQIATIKGKAKRMNMKLDVDPSKLTIDDASALITKMYDGESSAGIPELPVEHKADVKRNDIQLGLAVKLVYQRWASMHREPVTLPDVFKIEVLATYDLMDHIKGGEQNV